MTAPCMTWSPPPNTLLLLHQPKPHPPLTSHRQYAIFTSPTSACQVPGIIHFLCVCVFQYVPTAISIMSLTTSRSDSTWHLMYSKEFFPNVISLFQTEMQCFNSVLTSQVHRLMTTSLVVLATASQHPLVVAPTSPTLAEHKPVHCVYVSVVCV